MILGMRRRMLSEDVMHEVPNSQSWHCFGTSRSHLGLEKIWEGLCLSFVWNRIWNASVSSRSRALASYLQAHFQRQKYAEFSTGNRLSVRLHHCMPFTQSYVFHAIDLFMYSKHLRYFTLTYLSIWWRRRSCSKWIRQKRHTVLVKVIATTQWTWIWIASATCSKVRQQQ